MLIGHVLNSFLTIIFEGEILEKNSGRPTTSFVHSIIMEFRSYGVINTAAMERTVWLK